jgi:hypothetical protein
MTPSYLEKVKPVQPFDPESDGYDYISAVDSGGKPDEQTKHWQSLDPRTGMVLKGRNHPTWDLMVQEEAKLGNSIIKGGDGRYYSVKAPSYISKIKRVDGNDFADTQEDVVEKSASDYQFALENDVPLGFIDAVKEDWGNAQGRYKKIPIFGAGFEMKEKTEIVIAAERLSKNLYPEIEKNPVVEMINREILKYGTAEQKDAIYKQMIKQQGMTPENLKASDQKKVAAYLKYVAADKTAMYKLEKGISVLPTWIAEFAMTGGLASLGDNVATMAANKILGSYTKSAIGRLAVKTAGWASGNATRTFGLMGKVGSGFEQQHIDEIINLKEETGWATKIMRSWGDVYIEVLSEDAGKGMTVGGGILLSKLPFGSKAVDALSKTWMTITGGSKGEFLRKMSTKAGYSNILGEIGEERLGTTLRGLANVDTFGESEDANAFDRVKAGWAQDIENMWIEVGVLSVPMGAQFIGGRIVNREKTDKILTEIGVKTEEVKAAEEAAKTIQSEIDSQIATEPPTMPVDAKTETVGTETPVAEQPSPEAKPEIPPTRIEDANISKEVDNAVAQLVAGRADPEKSSLRQVDIRADRAMLGLDVVPSEERKSHLQALQMAKDEGYVENADENARRVLSGGAPLNRLEAAGALVRKAQINAEYRVKKQLLAKATEPAAISSLGVEIERLTQRFDDVTMAIDKSASEAARRLNMQKLTIDDDYNYLSVITRAKAKRGKELTLEQTTKIQKLTDSLEQAQRDIERLQNEVAELMARAFLKTGGVKKYKNMNKSEIELERDALLSEISRYKEC